MPDREALIRELQSLVAQAETMIGASTAHDSSGTFSNVRQRFDEIREHLADTYTSARKNLVAGAREIDGSIRANPYQSLAIASAAGFLVGMLASRRQG